MIRLCNFRKENWFWFFPLGFEYQIWDATLPFFDEKCSHAFPSMNKNQWPHTILPLSFLDLWYTTIQARGCWNKRVASILPITVQIAHSTKANSWSGSGGLDFWNFRQFTRHDDIKILSFPAILERSGIIIRGCSLIGFCIDWTNGQSNANDFKLAAFQHLGERPPNTKESALTIIPAVADCVFHYSLHHLDSRWWPDAMKPSVADALYGFRGRAHSTIAKLGLLWTSGQTPDRPSKPIQNHATRSTQQHHQWTTHSICCSGSIQVVCLRKQF